MKLFNIMGGTTKRGENEPGEGGRNDFDSRSDTQEDPFRAFYLKNISNEKLSLRT